MTMEEELKKTLDAWKGNGKIVDYEIQYRGNVIIGVSIVPITTPDYINTTLKIEKDAED